jgi:Ca2+/Na+ antiporter
MSFKHLLMLVVLLSALFQVGYGCLLLFNPTKISISLGAVDVSSNHDLMSVTRLYGKLFVTLGIMSGLVVALIQKELPIATVYTSLIGVNMIVTGVMAYAMTKNVVYLYADIVRGAAILACLYLYMFHDPN